MTVPEWLLLGTVVVILGALIGVWVSFWLDDRRAQRSRVEIVVADYVNLVIEAPERDHGPSAFIRSRARGLQSDAEVRTAVEEIVGRVGEANAPFSARTEALLDADLDLRAFLEELDPAASNFDEVCRRHGIEV